jgi:iron complex outermembrane receptor protein
MNSRVTGSKPSLARIAAALAPSALCAALAPMLAHAEAPVPIDAVVVSATRADHASFDLPVSIDAVDGETLREGQAQVNLSETLSRIPGVVVQNRQNYAQDLQISTRGFGARTAFGVRGVRLIADGIPATMPDGQGQAATFDLGSASRIEVLRGPFSTLYGNAAGGVIQAFTESGTAQPTVAGSVLFGSFGTSRVGLKAAGESEHGSYVANIVHFDTDGYRDHSAATRDTLNAKLKWSLASGGSLTLVANALDQPQTQDALGLSRALMLANPRQVDASALQFNTRKSIAQQQAGIVFERPFDDANLLRVMAYSGGRRVEQYQAIPVATQAGPLNPGGVIDLGREFGGLDLRLVHRGRVADGAATLTLGMNYDNMNEHRQGYQNFIGAQLGIKGALRRDENNKVSNFDQYLQGEWQAGERLSLLAGIRSSQVKFSSADQYVTGTNPDDSGGVRYSNTSPVAGAVWKIASTVNLYANAGRGFETPTFNELAYRAGGLTGLNFSLKPSVSDQYEIGIKAFPTVASRVNVALFSIRARDEIAVLTNAGGRSTYQNVGSTRREGMELGASAAFGGGFSASAAWTWVAASYLDGFLTCTAAPCNAPVTAVGAGKRMPGLPRQTAYAELAWRNGAGWFAALEVRASALVWVNDLNSEYAPGYAVANFRAGVEQRGGAWRVTEFIRIDNLFDRATVGSVIVGEANGRYYEPAPSRGAMAGVTASYSF